MITINVNENLGIMLFDGAFPRNDFETHQQRVDADTGLPLWTVNVILRQPDARRSENMTVNVPMEKNPDDVIQPFTQISFKGLRVMSGDNNGNTWVSFRADAVGVVGQQKSVSSSANASK